MPVIVYEVFFLLKQNLLVPGSIQISVSLFPLQQLSEASNNLNF